MAEKAKTSKKSLSTKSSPSKSSSQSNKASFRQQLRMKDWKILAIALVVIVIAILLAYLGRGVFVAATVNGEPIGRLEVVRALEKQSGAMILENLITKKLILQEAKRRNINVTQSDLDKEIATISESLKKQGTTLEQAMEAQGMKREELDDELKVQLALRKMIEKDVVVTEKEIEDFVTANAEQFAEGSTDAQKRELAKTQLQQQKNSEKTQALIEELQKKAEIIHLAGY